MIRYANAAAFKQAVEVRLRTASTSGHDFERRRQGGLVVELRVERARTTQDVDLRLTGAPTELITRLRRAAELELGDSMTFTVAPDADHPEITNEGMSYDGQRYRVACTLAGKPYGNPFGLDIAFADPIFGKPDFITTADTLAFAGIPPTTVQVYPLETHIAEKLHAYTIPRPRPNTRVKDLPDIALLAGVRDIDPRHLRAALDQTLGTLTRAVVAFLNPVLEGTPAGMWSPGARAWGAVAISGS